VLQSIINLREEIKMLSKTITKKGTSNFVLMPKDFLENLGLKTGDKVDVRLDDGKIIITPAIKENEVK